MPDSDKPPFDLSTWVTSRSKAVDRALDRFLPWPGISAIGIARKR